MRTLAAISMLALALAGSAAALTAQRAITLPGRVLTIGLTGRHVALAVGTTRRRCPQVQLWLTESNTRVRFPWTLRGCKEGPSTGFGVPSVAVAGTRVLWLSYIGGNLRDWQLWTATPTRRTARLLRFVERDVDASAPVVLGPGTREGAPYAVDREIVYLGENGRAIFRTTVAAPVRLLAAHARGRFGVRVAALLDDGRIVGLGGDGRELMSDEISPSVSAIALDDSVGVAYQIGGIVWFPGGTLRLPAGARMVDVAQGRVLWVYRGDLRATAVATGRAERLVDGTAERPVYGQLEAGGLAWAKGRLVRWSPGLLR